MGEIQSANPIARRVAVMIVASATAVGVVLIAVADRFRPEFNAWLEQDLHGRSTLVLVAMMIATSGPVLGLAGYLWQLGRRVVRAERYPPPGLRVIRDTPVIAGPVAGRRGRLIQVFAAILGGVAMLLTFLLWKLSFFLRTDAT